MGWMRVGAHGQDASAFDASVGAEGFQTDGQTVRDGGHAELEIFGQLIVKVVAGRGWVRWLVSAVLALGEPDA